MPRLRPIDPDVATGRARELLRGVQANSGRTPNNVRTMAIAPAVLQAYLSFLGALREGVLPVALQEQIALAVSEANGCDYCVSAHTALGKLVGLGENLVMDSRRGVSPDGKVEAALRFSRHLLETRGWVSDKEFSRLHGAGYGNEEVAEIVANVALNMFANYFNHVAQTEVDFPAAPDLDHTPGVLRGSCGCADEEVKR